MRCILHLMADAHRIELDRPTLLRLAADCDADPRTVARMLRGERVRGRAGERIARALRERGLLPREATAA